MTQRKIRGLKRLDKKFDALYKEMQTPESQVAFDTLMDATPDKLTQAARKSVKRKNAKKNKE